MTDHSKFAALILTHGRPDNVITYTSLRRRGYTGRVVFVIDNEDQRGEEYRERFGAENVVEFDKAAIAETFDTADTQSDRRTIVYARNASFAIARDLGLDYFVQLDDDYTVFMYRFLNQAGRVCGKAIRSLDAVFEAMLTFLDETDAATVAFSQGGDHMGAAVGNLTVGLRRKAMNTLFCRTDRVVTYLGRINEDVNTYVVNSGRGDLFLTVMGLQIDQVNTQQAAGGMTSVYLDGGTYLKSFYTVMMAPSAVAIGTMGRYSRRYHHHINWDRAAPKILSPKHRKARA